MRSSGDKWICSMLPYTQTAQQQSAAFLYITPQKITDSSGVETLTNQIHKTRDCSLNILFFLLRAFKISSLQQQPALWFCVYLLRNYRAFSSPWISLNNTIIQINRSFIDWGGTWCLAKELENWRLPSDSKLHLALQAVLCLGISIAFLWFGFVLFCFFSSLLAGLNFSQTLTKVDWSLRSTDMNLEDHLFKCTCIAQCTYPRELLHAEFRKGIYLDIRGRQKGRV